MSFSRTVMFGVSVVLAGYVSDAAADVWKCMSPGQKSPSFTDAPTGADGVKCEKVQGDNFTRSEGSGASAKKGSSGGGGSSAKTASRTKQKLKKSDYGPSKKKKIDDSFGGSKKKKKKKSH